MVNYGSQVINTGLAFVSSVFITRLLGAGGRGDYSLFTNSLQLFVIWLGFSLPTSVIFFVAGEKIDKNRIFTTMLLFCLLTSVLVILFLLALNQWGGLWIIFPEEYQSLNWQLFFVAQFFLMQLNGIVTAYLNAFKIFTPQAKFATVIAALSLMVWILLYYKVIVLPWTGFQLVVLMTFFLTIPVWLFALYILRKRKLVTPGKQLLQSKEFKMLFRFAFVAYLCNAMQFLSYRMDFWFVDYFQGEVKLGVYSLAVALAQLFWLLPNAIGPVLFSYISDSKNENGVKQVTQYSQMAFVVSVAGAVLFFCLAFFAIPVLYGVEFSGAGWMLGILLIGVLPFTITTILAAYFAGTNRLMVNFRASLVGLIFAIIGYVVLIPQLGTMGACLASVISYNASNAYLYYRFYKTTGVKIWRMNPVEIFRNLKSSIPFLSVSK